MNELTRTGIFVGAAVLAVGAAAFTRPSPPTLEQFSDLGEPFSPSFTDPLAAASLEVIDYDEDSGSARPFKVQVKDRRWTIPSHYDYPADGADRLARTASAMIDLRKDVIQSDRAQDHEALGVIDPLDDTTTTLKGRGTRVTLRDESEAPLADFIIGRAVEGKPGFRFIRVPNRKRTYAARMDADLSTRFADWIDTDLLDLVATDIRELQINDYSIDESTGRVMQAGLVQLARDDAETWQMTDLPPQRRVDSARIGSMTSSLAGLTITGVRPKPASLTSDLRTQEGITLDLPTQLSLQSRGFFISPDGRLLSNEGEITIGTREGVRYTLRFGEVLYGEGLAVSAGADGDADDDAPSGGAENRYVFITAEVDESLLPPRPEAPVPAPADDAPADEADEADLPDSNDATEAPDTAVQRDYEAALAEWEATAEAGREKARRLNDRFAPWYYVISAADFRTIRPGIEDLTLPIENDETEPAP